MYLCYFVQLFHLFITKLRYSAAGTGSSHELSIPMGRPSKIKESKNGRKSGPLQIYVLIQRAKHATNAYIGHKFEPRNRFSHCATIFRRISVRLTLGQIQEGITKASLQETDFYATNVSNTQVLEVVQHAARASQLLQYTNIPAANRQLLPSLWTIDALASGFQFRALEFYELDYFLYFNLSFSISRMMLINVRFTDILHNV
ncbi:MAG: hypothetical protein EZS28_036807 [Streblomastix strix]|uniref:Uncharacterized protein n=1 Tax=Streblomastix strix TaxID=222440 RepID=A0A5J4UAT3_9EUKA|nr:MAG: hypothetical protein EZS28_036807 [Streblomastix strix]